MKRLAFLILLFTAACRPVGERPATAAASTPASAPPSPVYVSALCTLMGNPVRSQVPYGRPVIVMWGWSAAARDQVEDYIRAAVAVVTFDGIGIAGRQQDGIPYDEAAKVYRAVWLSDVGPPKRGIHTVAYSLAFREKIFDGLAYYGPGTKNETMEDYCEIDVQ
jgi:hypothetical protein